MLHIIGTPIGNLEDVSYRAAHTLLSSDIILAEDTRSAQTLLGRIGELFPLVRNADRRSLPHIISYYKEKEFEKLPEVLNELKQDKTISLISESGMPVISDPGYLLLKHVIRLGLPYTVIPGPSAVTTALIHSGFKPDAFLFIGFLPKKQSHLEKQLAQLKQIKQIMPEVVFVAFESPHRIEETLQTIATALPESDVVIARELTKKFEEIIRIAQNETLEQRNWKGEITIVIS